MNNNSRALPTISLLCAFLLGAILFWSFGRNWLNFRSLLVFFVGLMGVAIPVLLFGVWNILRHSHDNKNEEIEEE
jgi:high-affinity Fe2+/Pb2+ permease